MAAPTLCLFNKFGFCKFSERCRKHHNNGICSSDTCNISECTRRHPKSCKYYRNYGRCKFSPCAFKHQNQIGINEGFEDMKGKIIFLENSVQEKNKQIEVLNSEILRLQTKVSEIETKSEEKVESFEQKVEKRFEALEKVMELFAKDLNVFTEHVNDLAVELHDDIGNMTKEKEEKSMDQTFKNPFLKLKCDLCEFEAKSERGLKTHKNRKHESCEWCAFVCKEESDLKKHKMDKHMLKYSAELLQCQGYL